MRSKSIVDGREFLSDVGRGMVIASVGAGLAGDLGCRLGKRSGHITTSTEEKLTMMRYLLAVVLFTGICLLQSPACLAQLKENATLKGHSSFVFRVSFSPDGQTLASASWDNTIKLWDVKTGKEIATLKGHTDVVYSVSFSPDGKTLASSGRDRTIKLWDVKTRKE